MGERRISCLYLFLMALGVGNILTVPARADQKADHAYREGAAALERNDHSTATEYCDQALSVAREANDHGSEVNALNNLGKVNNSLSRSDKAIENSNRALSIARKASDRKGEAGA